MPAVEIKNIKLKEKILYELATSFVDLNIHGIRDQFPIPADLIYSNFIPFRELIVSCVERNINAYSEITLAQILMLLSYRPMHPPIEIYNLVLDTLISKREDATLQGSINLNYSKAIDLPEIKITDNFKKYILWAELNTDIDFPIFRGFGFNFYTAGDRFFKEFFLSNGKFAYCCKIIERPEYLMTGHNRKAGKFEDYKFYGKLPSKPSYPEFDTDHQKIKYAIDKILKNIGVAKEIAMNKVTLDTKNQVVIKENISEEDRQKQIFSTFKHLKRMCGIEEQL